MRTPFDARDVLIAAGLSLLGVGLYFWFGLGPALAIPGGVITLISIPWVRK